MNAALQPRDIHPPLGAATEPTLGPLAVQRDLEERADRDEDRRRERELEYGELGGEG